MTPESAPAGIRWNEVTWYSKLGAIVLFVGVVPALSFYIGTQYQAVLDAKPSVSDSTAVSKPAITSLPGMALHKGGDFQTTNYAITPDGALSYYHADEKGEVQKALTLSSDTRAKLIEFLTTVDLASLKKDPPPPPDATYYKLSLTTDGRKYEVMTHLASNKAYALFQQLDQLLQEQVVEASSTSKQSPTVYIGKAPRLVFEKHDQLRRAGSSIVLVEKCVKPGYPDIYLVTENQKGFIYTFGAVGASLEGLYAFYKASYSCGALNMQSVERPSDIPIPAVVSERYKKIGQSVSSKSVAVCQKDPTITFSVTSRTGSVQTSDYYSSTGEKLGTNLADDTGRNGQEFNATGYTCDILLFEPK